jgi:nucleoside-diphosphate-sugar epimerase
MGDASKVHTYAYVPDIAKAVVRLALDADIYNQTWHLPTSGPITGTDFMQQVSAAVGNKGKWSVMTRKSMRVMGIFVPILLELREMMYQFEHDYVLDSSKFAAKYPDFVPTTYEQGIKATIDATK